MAAGDVDGVLGIDVIRSGDAIFGAGDVITVACEDLTSPGDNIGIDDVIITEVSSASRDVSAIVVDVIRTDVDFAGEVVAVRFGNVMVTSSFDVTGP